MWSLRLSESQVDATKKQKAHKYIYSSYLLNLSNGEFIKSP